MRDEKGRILRGHEVPSETRRKMSEAQKGHKVSLRTRRKISKAKSGKKNYFFGRTLEKNHNWNGGKCISYGYIRIYQGHGKYRPEHCLIAEEALGRPLRQDEVVHHINGIRDDNRPQNLLVCTRSYHQWLERRMSDLYKKEYFTDAHNLEAHLERVVDRTMPKRPLLSLS